MNNETLELMRYFCPYGFLDIKAACEIGDELLLDESELFEIIDEFREGCGYKSFDSIDPVAAVLDHVLQQARQHIENITGYDFINDYRWGWSEIYTYGNYMCSAYDRSSGAWEELKEKTAPYWDELIEDKWCSYLFEALEMGE